jgi:hypothetical protein
MVPNLLACSAGVRHPLLSVLLSLCVIASCSQGGDRGNRDEWIEAREAGLGIVDGELAVDRNVDSRTDGCFDDMALSRVRYNGVVLAGDFVDRLTVEFLEGGWVPHSFDSVETDHEVLHFKRTFGDLDVVVSLVYERGEVPVGSVVSVDFMVLNSWCDPDPDLPRGP